MCMMRDDISNYQKLNAEILGISVDSPFTLAKFKEENPSIVCKELLGLSGITPSPVPAARTQEYYKKRPCVDLVGDAAEILEKFYIK